MRHQRHYRAARADFRGAKIRQILGRGGLHCVANDSRLVDDESGARLGVADAGEAGELDVVGLRRRSKTDEASGHLVAASTTGSSDAEATSSARASASSTGKPASELHRLCSMNPKAIAQRGGEERRRRTSPTPRGMRGSGRRRPPHDR